MEHDSLGPTSLFPSLPIKLFQMPDQREFLLSSSRLYRSFSPYEISPGITKYYFYSYLLLDNYSFFEIFGLSSHAIFVRAAREDTSPGCIPVSHSDRGTVITPSYHSALCAPCLYSVPSRHSMFLHLHYIYIYTHTCISYSYIQTFFISPLPSPGKAGSFKREKKEFRNSPRHTHTQTRARCSL